MKITIERGTLLRALSHVQSIIERRTTIPVLANVLLSASNGLLELRGTDLDIEVTERVPAIVITPGTTTVSAVLLYEIMSKLDGESVEIELAKDACSIAIKCGRSRFKLAVLSAEDFPAVMSGKLAHNFEIAAADLRTLIDSVAFAVSTEETRYYLNGIYLHRHGAHLRSVSTDGHRLARCEIALPAGAQDITGVIIPRKTFTEVRKLVDKRTDHVSVTMSETKIGFGIGDVTVTSKLIDGTFPDYQRVIPTGNNVVIEVKSSEIDRAVDRVIVVATEKTRAIKLSFTKGLMTLSAQGAETGTSSEEIDIGYTGHDLEIGYNSKYLSDLLRQIKGDVARFLLLDAGAPSIITDPGRADFLSVLMPMKV